MTKLDNYKKNTTFDISIKILGPVHLLTKTDKWDYVQLQKKNVSCFDIGEDSRSPGKWNWNWLSFLPFIFIFKLCVVKPILKYKQINLFEAFQTGKFRQIIITIPNQVLCYVTHLNKYLGEHSYMTSDFWVGRQVKPHLILLNKLMQ